MTGGAKRRRRLSSAGIVDWFMLIRSYVHRDGHMCLFHNVAPSQRYTERAPMVIYIRMNVTLLLAKHKTICKLYVYANAPYERCLPPDHVFWSTDDRLILSNYIHYDFTCYRNDSLVRNFCNLVNCYFLEKFCMQPRGGWFKFCY